MDHKRKVAERVSKRGLELLQRASGPSIRSSRPSTTKLEKVGTIELVRGAGGNRKENDPKAHHRISSGDVVRVQCRRGTECNTIVDTIDSKEKVQVSHASSLFLVVSLARDQDGKLWAMAIRLHTSTNHCEHRFQMSEAHVQLFKLTNTLTKCAVFHNCQRTKGCIINYQTKHIVHKLKYNEIVHVFVLTGQNGFPSRSA